MPRKTYRVKEPKVGSVWLARDGRRMKVRNIKHSPWAIDGWWAEMDVLPPYAPRQRRTSSQSSRNFSDGFLVEETAAAAQQHGGG